MKKCPFCAEEVQDEAIVCKHCGREIIPLQPSVRTNPQPVSQSSTAIPINPKISLAMQKYTKAGYKVTSAFGDTANLERPGAKFIWWLFWILFWFLTPILPVYLAIYFIWQVKKTYNIQLVTGADGQVQELGDTIEMYERDMLQASQKRYSGFGVFFGILLGGIAVLFAFLALVMGPTEANPTWGETIGLSIGILILLGAPTIGPGVFMLWRSKKLQEKLNAGI